MKGSANLYIKAHRWPEFFKARKAGTPCFSRPVFRENRHSIKQNKCGRSGGVPDYGMTKAAAIYVNFAAVLRALV